VELQAISSHSPAIFHQTLRPRQTSGQKRPERLSTGVVIRQDEIEAGKISYVKKEQPVVKPLVAETGIPIL